MAVIGRTSRALAPFILVMPEVASQQGGQARGARGEGEGVETGSGEG